VGKRPSAGEVDGKREPQKRTMMVILFLAKLLVLKYRTHESLYFRFFYFRRRTGGKWQVRKGFDPMLRRRCIEIRFSQARFTSLEGYYAVNAICAEDAEFALVITAKVDEAATALSCTGQRNLVDRPDALAVFILEQHNGLASHGCGQAKIRELDDLAVDRLLRRGNRGLGLGVHSTIEAEEMYPLK
jgi:hypothetical protein